MRIILRIIGIELWFIGAMQVFPVFIEASRPNTIMGAVVLWALLFYLFIWIGLIWGIISLTSKTAKKEFWDVILRRRDW